MTELTELTELLTFDTAAAGKVSFKLSNPPDENEGETIPFQFPPRVTSDGKSSEWEERSMGDFEKVKFYLGSDSRKLSVEFDYIATGGSFNTTTIPKYLRIIKGYFYISLDEGSSNYPAVSFKLFEVIPTAATFRLSDVNMGYSDTLVLQDGKYFYLKTTVSLSLELVTNVKGKIQMPNLGPIKKEWY